MPQRWIFDWLGPSQWVCQTPPHPPSHPKCHLAPGTPRPQLPRIRSRRSFLLRRAPCGNGAQTGCGFYHASCFQGFNGEDFLFLQGVSLPQKIQDLSSHHSIRAGSIGQRGNAPLDPVPPAEMPLPRRQRQWSARRLRPRPHWPGQRPYGWWVYPDGNHRHPYRAGHHESGNMYAPSPTRRQRAMHLRLFRRRACKFPAPKPAESVFPQTISCKTWRPSERRRPATLPHRCAERPQFAPDPLEVAL